MIGVGLWDASFAALWVLVIVDTIVLIALLRQVGVLLLRVGQIAAPRTNQGPAPGEILAIPEIAEYRSGETDLHPDGQDSRRRQVLLFVSLECGLCGDMVPAANAVARGYGDRFDVALVADANPDELSKWHPARRSKTRVVPAPGVLKRYNIPGTPFASIVDERGVVLTSGWVNHLEHLESLVRSCPATAGEPGSDQGGTPGSETQIPVKTLEGKEA